MTDKEKAIAAWIEAAEHRIAELQDWIGKLRQMDADRLEPEGFENELKSGPMQPDPGQLYVWLRTQRTKEDLGEAAPEDIWQVYAGLARNMTKKRK